jgi:Flp pilus assembly protein TadB
VHEVSDFTKSFPPGLIGLQSKLPRQISAVQQSTFSGGERQYATLVIMIMVVMVIVIVINIILNIIIFIIVIVIVICRCSFSVLWVRE